MRTLSRAWFCSSPGPTLWPWRVMGCEVAGSIGSAAKLPGFPSPILRNHSDPPFSEIRNRDDGAITRIRIALGMG